MILDSDGSGKPEPRVLGVIPARLASTRLPGKVLREIAGRPMLAWVFEAAQRCTALDAIVVATDSDDVAELCRKNGWPCEMTSPELASGSDRVYAVSERIPAAIYVNIQGDEPMLRPEHLESLLEPFARPEVEVTTLRVHCADEEIHNPNSVKVVTAADGRALYFSRAAVPYDQDNVRPTYWKHMGIYAYRKAALQRFHALRPSTLEQAERLEQLRLLENGIALYVATTEIDTIGVDTDADLAAVDRLMRERRQLG
jgi:3-deoxy-manno-octulosonate cytidylyltransferase (CMP-KDO synthetase)